jgi:hypothetical protein
MQIFDIQPRSRQLMLVGRTWIELQQWIKGYLMLEVSNVALQFLRHPKPPTVRIETPSGTIPYVIFDADPFEIEASVTLRGASADTAGPRLGWTQLQTLDVNRAAYRGQTSAAGRVEVFRDRSTKAMGNLCRDVSFASDVFTCPAGTRRGLGYTPRHAMNIDLGKERIPGTVLVSHADKPGDAYFTQYDNERTRQPNYLTWVMIEMQFCVVLLLKHRDGRLQQLKHFNWGLKLEDRFEPVLQGKTVASVRRIGTGVNNRVTFKPFIDGPVTDGNIAALIAAPTGMTCNERAYLRNNNPQVRQHSSW